MAIIYYFVIVKTIKLCGVNSHWVHLWPHLFNVSDIHADLFVGIIVVFLYNKSLGCNCFKINVEMASSENWYVCTTYYCYYYVCSFSGNFLEKLEISCSESKYVFTKEKVCKNCVQLNQLFSGHLLIFSFITYDKFGQIFHELYKCWLSYVYNLINCF